MRYTTVIDISEIPDIYRNKNVSRLYFHLCLKAGYHDDDRDEVKFSIRRMAFSAGLSLSATRNAVLQLKKHGLLEQKNGVLKVRKFIVDAPITKRARKRKEIDTGTAVRDAMQEETTTRIKAGEKTSWMVMYEMKMKAARAGDKAAQKFVQDKADFYKQQCEMIKKELEQHE